MWDGNTTHSHGHDSLFHDRARALRVPPRSVARTALDCIISGSRACKLCALNLHFRGIAPAVMTTRERYEQGCSRRPVPISAKAQSIVYTTTTTFLRLSSCETRCMLPFYGMFHAQNTAVNNQCNPDPHSTRLVSTCITAATVCGVPQHLIISDEGASAR
jgi:hypothetical protein